MCAALKFTKLSCGVPVCLQSSSETKLLTITVWIRGGSETDPPGKTGLAHLCEHLLLRPLEETSSQARRLLLNSGALINGRTDSEWVSISAQAPIDQSKLLIELVAMLIMNPDQRNDWLEQEKTVLANEYSLLAPSALEELVNAFYLKTSTIDQRNNCYGEKKKLLDQLDLADINSYYRRHLNANRILVTIHGTSDCQDLIENLDRALRNLPGTINEVSEKAFGNGQEDVFFHDYKPIKMIPNGSVTAPSNSVGLLIGYRGPNRLCKDYWSALAFEAMMADGIGSCLYRWLRTEDLGVYAITSRTEAYSKWGSQYFLIQLDSGRVKKALKCLGEHWKLFPHHTDTEQNTMLLNKFVTRVLTSLAYPHDRMTLMRDLMGTSGRDDRIHSESLESIVLEQAKELSHHDISNFYNRYAKWDLVSLIIEPL